MCKLMGFSLNFPVFWGFLFCWPGWYCNLEVFRLKFPCQSNFPFLTRVLFRVLFVGHAESTPKQFSVEGVSLTESGFRHFTSLSSKKSHSRRPSLKSGSLAILQSLADPNSELSVLAEKEYSGGNIHKGNLVASLPTIGFFVH